MITARIARHPRRALLGSLAFLLVAIVFGGPIFGALEDGDGFVARPRSFAGGHTDGDRCTLTPAPDYGRRENCLLQNSSTIRERINANHERSTSHHFQFAGSN